MERIQQCAFVIPVFNEEGAIFETVSRLKEVLANLDGWQTHIVCVNDGSTDGTGSVLKKLTGVQVLHHNRNRGYGAALKTGLRACQNFEWVAIVDADSTYPLEDFPRLMAVIRDQHPDDDPLQMVVGSRVGEGISSNIPKIIARFILKRLVYAVTGCRVSDLNSGMRVFKYSLYEEFSHLLPMGFSFTTTLTVASLYSGYHVEYRDIQYNIRTGKSHIKPFRDFLNFTILIARLASYFEPMRLFLPIGYVLVSLGVIRGIRDVIVGNFIGALAVMLVLMGIQCFFNGIILDTMQRRFRSAEPKR